MPAHNIQPIGTAFIVYGTVKAIAPDGTERILSPNSPIHAGERIITGPDGSISVLFLDQSGQLDLGRMSDVLIDEDIFAGVDQGVTPDAVAMVEDIQTALLEDEDFDPTVDLPPPAAGGGVAGTGGGGRKIVVFTPDQEEVLPDSGAETTGIGYSFLDPPGGIIPEGETLVTVMPPSVSPVSPVTPPVPSFVPPDVPPIDPPIDPPDVPVEYPIGAAVRTLREAKLADGTDPDSTALIVEGTLADLNVDFGSSTSGVLDFGDGLTIVIDGNSGNTISIPGEYGNLIVRGDGTWSFTLVDNTLDHSVPGGVELDDVVNDLFPFAAIYPDGTRVEGGNVLINVLDDGPLISIGGEIVPILVHEDALGNTDFSNNPVNDNSTGIIEPEGEDSLGNTFTDIGSIDLAGLVTLQYGADGPGPGTVSYQITGIGPDGVASGLTSNGVEVFYYINDDGDLVALAGGPEGPNVFTFKVDGDGLATFDLNDQLDHPSASGDDAFLTIDNLGQYVQVSIIDGDGDTATATFDGYVQVEVENDVPVRDPEAKGLSAVVGENGVYELATTVEFELDTLVSNNILTPGADAPLSYYFMSIGNDFDTGLESQGVLVKYAVSEARDILTAFAESADHGEPEIIFTFTLIPNTGEAEFNLVGTLDHDEGNQVKVIDLGQYIQATDTDGDYVTLNGLVEVVVVDDPSSDNGEIAASNTGETATLAFPPVDEQENTPDTDGEKETDQEEDSGETGLISPDTDADNEPQSESQSDGQTRDKDEAQSDSEESKTEGQEGSGSPDGDEPDDALDSDFSNEGDLVTMDNGVGPNDSLS